MTKAKKLITKRTHMHQLVVVVVAGGGSSDSGGGSKILVPT